MIICRNLRLTNVLSSHISVLASRKGHGHVQYRSLLTDEKVVEPYYVTTPIFYPNAGQYTHFVVL